MCAIIGCQGYPIGLKYYLAISPGLCIYMKKKTHTKNCSSKIGEGHVLLFYKGIWGTKQFPLSPLIACLDFSFLHQIDTVLIPVQLTPILGISFAIWRFGFDQFWLDHFPPHLSWMNLSSLSNDWGQDLLDCTSSFRYANWFYWTFEYWLFKKQRTKCGPHGRTIYTFESYCLLNTQWFR